MTPIDIKQNGPLNDLIFAITHYVSTGDYVGECIALESETDPDAIIILLTENTSDPVDSADFAKFMARAKEIAATGLYATFAKAGSSAPFRSTMFTLRNSDVPAWALALLSSPGAGEWGSLKPILDQHFPGQRENLIAKIGEGQQDNA